MKHNLLFGTDPEFAVRNNSNRIVSAIPVLERGKENKIFFDEKQQYAIYFDNVLAEGNVPPSASSSELKERLRTLYAKSKEVLRGHKLSAVASHTFDDAECDHPEAKRFGCDPELDAYIASAAYPPDGGHSFRSAGGHIHIGNLTTKEIEEKANLVFLLDIFVGVPSVILDNDPTSLDRKKLYGKAGRFRDTSYGLEYRVLSNFWLSSPELTDIIYDLTIYASVLFEEGKGQAILDSCDMQQVAEIINTANKESARKFIDNLGLPENLYNRIIELSQAEYSDDIFENWKL